MCQKGPLGRRFFWCFGGWGCVPVRAGSRVFALAGTVPASNNTCAFRQPLIKYKGKQNMRQRTGGPVPCACMGVQPPTQRLSPHRIGQLYRLPGPFASISRRGRLAVDGLIVVSERLCAAGPGDAYRIFLLMLCRVIPTRHFLFFPIRLEARRGSLAGLLGENKIFQEEES